VLDPAADLIGGIFVKYRIQQCQDQHGELDLTAIDSIAFIAPTRVFMATLPCQNRVILTTACASSLFNMLILNNFNRINKWHAYCYCLW
jgi:hypothetical protein